MPAASRRRRRSAGTVLFFTDFSLGTNGEQLPDLRRERFGTHWDSTLVVRNSVATGVTGGKVLRNEGSTDKTHTASREWAWLAVPVNAVVDIVVKQRAGVIGPTAADAAAFGCYGYGTGTDAGTSNRWGCRIYHNGTVNKFQLWSYVNNVFTDNVEVAIDAGYAVNTWMWQRLRIDATGVYAKHWKDGNAEPGAWQVTHAHRTEIVPGTCGVYSDNATATEETDILSVVVGGGSAALTGTSVAHTTAYLGPKTSGMTALTLNPADAGSTPAGWTPSYNTSGVTWPVTDLGGGVYGVRSVHTAGDKRSMLAAPLGFANTIQEIVLKLTNPLNAANGNGAALRIESGGAAADSSYNLEIDTTLINFIKFTNGTFANVGSGAGYLPAVGAGVAYWIRFRVSGTTLQGKVWRSTEPEPMQWMIVSTDASLASGGLGLYHYIGGGSTAADRTVDYSDLYYRLT